MESFDVFSHDFFFFIIVGDRLASRNEPSLHGACFDLVMVLSYNSLHFFLCIAEFKSVRLSGVMVMS